MAKVLDEAGLRQLVKTLKAELKKKAVKKREDRILMRRGIAVLSSEDPIYRNVYVSQRPCIRIPSEYKHHKVCVFINGKRQDMLDYDINGYALPENMIKERNTSYIYLNSYSVISIQGDSYVTNHLFYPIKNYVDEDGVWRIYLHMSEDLPPSQNMVSYNGKMMIMNGYKKCLAIPRYETAETVSDSGMFQIKNNIFSSALIYRWKSQAFSKDRRTNGAGYWNVKKWCHCKDPTEEITNRIKLVRVYKGKKSINYIVLYCYIIKADNFRGHIKIG